MDVSARFRGKKITLLGLGLLGRGVGDAKFLAENGADLIVTDMKSASELATSVETLRGFTNVTFHLDGHDSVDFKDRDFVLKAAGVSLNSPDISEARKNGIPIKMSASWFAEIAQIPVVGVTGTRGKSTTTQLLYDIMQAPAYTINGICWRRHTLLGGHVRGVSTLALLPDVTRDSMALMELDSWQLEGFGEAKISPNIAVFTTFYPDHMNYYGSTSLTTSKAMDAYLADKAQIFLNQKPEDTLVVSTQVAPIIKEKYGKRIVSRVVIADSAKFPKGWKLQIPGEHNKLNVMCAIEAARALGIDEEIIRKAAENFKGMPGRLEFLREIKGVKIYNDTTATTPEATIAALHALNVGFRKPYILLIAGGADKGLDMSGLIAELSKCKKVILLAGAGTDRIKERLPDSSIFGTIGEALGAALAGAESGDIILFSPASASFGMFKNEFDRGDQFNELVKKLS